MALCSGIGGLELGLHIALDAYRTVCYVELEAFCAASLVARMEDSALDQAPIWDDIKTFSGESWRGIVDIVTAGYPCQPFSVAGYRRGTSDPRHLWPSIASIIRAVGPPLVFLENVPGHLKLGFDEVARDLVGMGYGVAATLLTAAEIGAPHKRERLFALAQNTGRKRCGGGNVLGNPPRMQRKIQTSGLCGTLADVGHAYGAGLGGRSSRTVAGAFPAPWPLGPADIDEWRRILEERPELAPAVAGAKSGKSRQTGITPRFGNAVEGAAKPLVCGMVDGIPYRVDRLRELGNAVVPVQAAMAFLYLWDELSDGYD